MVWGWANCLSKGGRTEGGAPVRALLLAAAVHQGHCGAGGHAREGCTKSVEGNLIFLGKRHSSRKGRVVEFETSVAGILYSPLVRMFLRGRGSVA